jgi:iron(III) transport system substrate-binding protein
MPEHHLTTALIALLALTACAGQASAPVPSQARASQSSTAGAADAALRSQWTPGLQKIIDGAQKEGTLNLSWGEPTLGGTAGAKLFEAGMNKMFGTSVKISFTPGPSQPEIAGKIVTEQQAGEKAASDVFVGAGTSVQTLIDNKALNAVDWPKLLPSRIPAEASEQNLALRIITGIPGIEYNTNIVKPDQVPKTMEDLLKPEWKGKFATTPYAAGFDLLSATDAWGPDKTIDYVKRLSPQLAGLIRCGETQRITSGEFPLFGLDCDGTSYYAAQRQGAPIGQVVPLDAAQKRYFYLAVPKNAEHPNAATLYTVFSQTPEGQQLSYETWGSDLDVYPDSKTHATVDKLTAAGAKFFAPSVEYLSAHTEIKTTTDQLTKILAAAK